MRRLSRGATPYLAHSFQPFAVGCLSKRLRSFDSRQASSLTTHSQWLAQDDAVFKLGGGG